MATTARELTKINEEIRRDFLENQIKYYRENAPKGEITLIVEGEEKEAIPLDESEIIEKIRILKKAGYPSKEISKILSLLTQYSKHNIYELTIKQET